MDVLAKKLAILAALLAMVVAVSVGGVSGVQWELVLMRGGGAFFLVLLSSMVLFKLALQDRPRAAEDVEQKGETGGEPESRE